MKSWKHSMSALMAVVMVATLATIQVKDMSAALASKETEEEIVLEILENNESSETVELDDDEVQKVRETVEEITSISKVETAKPYEPKAGYVIATSAVLNVRAEKSKDSEVIGRLNPGQELWLEGEYEDWYLITFTSNDGVAEKGYVSKEFVTTSYDEAKDILLEDVMYEKATITAGAEMKSAPDMNASGLEIFQTNEEVIIISRVNDGWSQIYTTDDYTAGYVLNSGLTLANKMVLKEEVIDAREEIIKSIGTPGVVYSASGNVNVRTMPGEDKEIKTTLPSGTSCLLVKTIDGWVKISYGDYIAGYVKSEYTMTKASYDAMKAEEARKQEEARRKEAAAKQAKTAAAKSAKSSSGSGSIPYAAPSSKGQQIVNIASQYLGVRYVYGGTSPSGFDCSGLVQYVCRKAGVNVNRTSRDQYRNGVAVAKSDLQPGDLVFFSKGSSISHVGIYAGNGQVIHSPRPGKSVCYVSLASMCSYSNYVGARRVY